MAGSCPFFPGGAFFAYGKPNENTVSLSPLQATPGTLDHEDKAMSKAANSVAIYAKFFLLSRVKTVLDYGAGTLRNALFLLDQGFTVYAADLPQQVQALRSHPGVQRLAGLLEVEQLQQSRLGVDLVLSTYVFNIISQKEKRQRYLENVVSNLRPGGQLLMEVCSRRDETEWGSAGDLQPNCGDCARTFSHGQLDALLAPYGLQRVCHYYRHHALAAVFRLSADPGPGFL